jgi:hypothetical protein
MGGGEEISSVWNTPGRCVVVRNQCKSINETDFSSHVVINDRSSVCPRGLLNTDHAFSPSRTYVYE